MLRVSAVYPNILGSRFDGGHYLGAHAALAERLLQPHGLRELRATLGVEGLNGGPPAYWAISEMLFGSRAEFDAAMAMCGQALFDDAKNYTNVDPVLQISWLSGDPSK